MPLVTRQLMNDLGVAISDDELASLSEHIESTLDTRVTDEIVAELSNDEVRELNDLADAADEVRMEWLRAHVPELREIIEDETAILLGELAEHSDRLG